MNRVGPSTTSCAISANIAAVSLGSLPASRQSYAVSATCSGVMSIRKLTPSSRDKRCSVSIDGV